MTRRFTQAPRCYCGTTTPGLHARHCPLAVARGGTPAAAWFYGQSFHQPPAVPPNAVTPTPYVDTRPRRDYRLPDGKVFRFILDHEQVAPATITVALKGGAIVRAALVEVAS